MKKFNGTLTELEKKVLKDGLLEGYIYDGYYDESEEENFLCYGFEGKRERGAASSLVKKGIIRTADTNDGEYVYLLISLSQAEQLVKNWMKHT